MQEDVPAHTPLQLLQIGDQAPYGKQLGADPRDRKLHGWAQGKDRIMRAKKWLKTTVPTPTPSPFPMPSRVTGTEKAILCQPASQARAWKLSVHIRKTERPSFLTQLLSNASETATETLFKDSYGQLIF